MYSSSSNERSISEREGDYWDDDYTSFYLEPQDYLYEVQEIFGGFTVGCDRMPPPTWLQGAAKEYLALSKGRYANVVIN